MSQRRRLIQDGQQANPVEAVHVWRTPPGAAVDLVILTRLGLYASIHEQAVEALPNETGGFLLGRVGLDAPAKIWHLQVEEAIPVTPDAQGPTGFTFSWRDVDRVRRRRDEQRKAVLGWYHTHPGFGIFLSPIDLDRTHRALFSEPFQIALVYDPERGRAGYFFWEGREQIDVSEAAWREFAVVLAGEDAASPNDLETPPAGRSLADPGSPGQTRAPAGNVSRSVLEDAPHAGNLSGGQQRN